MAYDPKSDVEIMVSGQNGLLLGGNDFRKPGTKLSREDLQKIRGGAKKIDYLIGTGALVVVRRKDKETEEAATKALLEEALGKGPRDRTEVKVHPDLPADIDPNNPAHKVAPEVGRTEAPVVPGKWSLPPEGLQDKPLDELNAMIQERDASAPVLETTEEAVAFLGQDL